MSQRAGLGDDLLQALGGDRQELAGLAHHGGDVYLLPGEHGHLAHEAAHLEYSHRPRFARDVVEYLYLAFEDDHELVGGVPALKRTSPTAVSVLCP
jgi:hypothetical protein